jgi:hypothetical protein
VDKDFTGYIPGVHLENIVLTQYVEGRQVGLVIYPISEHENIVGNMNAVFDSAMAKIAAEVEKLSTEAMSGAVVDPGEDPPLDEFTEFSDDVEVEPTEE